MNMGVAYLKCVFVDRVVSDNTLMRCALFYRTEKLAVEGETPVSLRFARKSPLSLGLLDMGLASLSFHLQDLLPLSVQ